MTWILETSPSYAYVFLRLGLAVTFFFHSTQQIFGWHGGRGLKAHLANWRDRQRITNPTGATHRASPPPSARWGCSLNSSAASPSLPDFSRGHSHCGWPFSSVSHCSNLMCST